MPITLRAFEAPEEARSARGGDVESVSVVDLEDQELRLLALAVGDHLPIEIRLRIASLRDRRGLSAAAP